MPPEKAATYHLEKDTPYTIAPPTVCSVLIIRLITDCGVTLYHTSWGKVTSLRLLLPMFHSQIWQPWLHVFFLTQHKGYVIVCLSLNVNIIGVSLGTNCVEWFSWEINKCIYTPDRHNGIKEMILFKSGLVNIWAHFGLLIEPWVRELSIKGWVTWEAALLKSPCQHIWWLKKCYMDKVSCTSYRQLH